MGIFCYSFHCSEPVTPEASAAVMATTSTATATASTSIETKSVVMASALPKCAHQRLASVDEDSQTFTEFDLEELSFLKHGIPEHIGTKK